MAREDARCEMLDHEDHLSTKRVTDAHLPINRFKRKMDLSDEDWFDSLPNAMTELRKGRRDMLRAVLDAADSQEQYSYASATPSAVKKVLQALPSNRNTKPALKSLPLADVIKLTSYPTISPKTINSHIQMFSSFFDWAERHGHTSTKLFTGMKVAKAKNSANERKPFSQHLIRLIFTELTDNPSGIVSKESHKWGALIGMFTGARLNEICQLEVADVQKADGIWFLNITDEGDNNKRVKAKASRRKVPVHSELVRLGLLEFVDSRKHALRLFHDFSYSSNGGYGRSLGRWYNETFLPKLGIKERALVFHSLRHTVVTRLAQAGVVEPIYQCLVGHARDGVTQEVYMREGYTLGQLSEAIEKYEV